MPYNHIIHRSIRCIRPLLLAITFCSRLLQMHKARPPSDTSVFFIYFNLCKSFCLGINKQILCLHALNGYRLFSSHPCHPAGMVFAVHDFNGTIAKKKLWNRRWKTEYHEDCCKVIWLSLVQCSSFNVNTCLGRIASIRSSPLGNTHSFIWRNFFFTDYDYLAGGKYAKTNAKGKRNKELKVYPTARRDESQYKHFENENY